MYESNDKMVSHPDHYQSKKGLEVIDVIEAFTEDLKGIEATDTGNIIKYACRWKNKNGIQDLRKIMWYCQHLIEHLETEEVREALESKIENTYDADIAYLKDTDNSTRILRDGKGDEISLDDLEDILKEDK